MQYTLVAEDLNGNPLNNNTIAAGNDFKLAAFVQDVRNPADAQPGTVSAVLSVSYDPANASITSSSHAAGTADPGIVFGGVFTSLPEGDLSTAGQITGAGAVDFSIPRTDTANPQLIWTVTVHANVSGTETFTPSFFADLQNDLQSVLGNGPQDDTRQATDPIPQEDINYLPLNVTITPGTTPEVSFSNVTQAEGNGPSNTNFVFTASLSVARRRRSRFPTRPATARRRSPTTTMSPPAARSPSSPA